MFLITSASILTQRIHEHQQYSNIETLGIEEYLWQIRDLMFLL